jgi:hypothetical protein
MTKLLETSLCGSYATVALVVVTGVLQRSDFDIAGDGAIPLASAKAPIIGNVINLREAQ